MEQSHTAILGPVEEAISGLSSQNSPAPSPRCPLLRPLSPVSLEVMALCAQRSGLSKPLFPDPAILKYPEVR